MKENERKIRLSKQFALISFVAISLAALLILLFFRYETIRVIEKTSRDSNESLTVASEYALNDHFLTFLRNADSDDPDLWRDNHLDSELRSWVAKLLINTQVVRVKVYNRFGRVVFSTKQSQIGDGQESNDGYRKAMAGEVTTVLIYRDTFNFYDQETEEDNLVQTYVPVRDRDQTIKGVLEIYSDINEQVDLSVQITILVWGVVTLIMFFLFAVLQLYIRRAESIIESQNRETRERKKLLEMLSVKMINAQEDEKKRIAFELHEDVVQSLSGVKMQLERYILSLNELGESDSKGIQKLTKDFIPDLQTAARRIRLVAMDLRPPSLDDFGLNAAVNSLISECQSGAQGFSIIKEFSVEEKEISKEHQVVVYRLVQEIIASTCFKMEFFGELRITLDKSDGELELKILVESDQLRQFEGEELPDFLVAMRERSILSGGDFEILDNLEGYIEVESCWLD